MNVVVEGMRDAFLLIEQTKLDYAHVGIYTETRCMSKNVK